MNTVENGQIVEHLNTALRRGGMSLSVIPGLLKRIIKEDMWRERTLKTGKVATFNSFLDFITAPPLDGLGEEPAVIERLIQDDAETLTLFRELAVPAKGTNQHTKGTDNVSIHSKGHGNSKAYTLSRLKEQSPALFREVVEGKLSANKAAIKAGIRKVKTPVEVMKAAWVKASKSERAAIRKFIADQ